MKNALDWLVGSGSLYRRCVGVLSAGTTGGTFAIDQLVRTISWQGGLVVSVLSIAAPKTKMNDSTGVFNERETLGSIEDWTAQTVGAATASPPDRLAMVAMVVTRYGIDPTRFGTLTD